MLLMLLGACVKPTYSLKNHDPNSFGTVNVPVSAAELPPAEVQAILDEIQKRNSTVEDDPKWIRKAYNGLMVRKLNNISEREYKKYAKYLDEDDSVYIIVHPSFFPFFHYNGSLPDLDKEGFVPKHNIVDRLLSMSPPDERLAVLQAQERRTRDFIEFMSTREKLVIVVVPRNYNKYRGYLYRKGPDEYTRYLNEITNLSDSIIFAESRSPNLGYLTNEDGIRMMEFLLSIKAKNIYIGGGYIGRCLEDFYVLMTEEFGKEDIYIIPELSDVSPKELGKRMARNLLTPEGGIDAQVATSYLMKDVYRIQEVVPRIKHLRRSLATVEALQ